MSTLTNVLKKPFRDLEIRMEAYSRAWGNEMHIPKLVDADSWDPSTKGLPTIRRTSGIVMNSLKLSVTVARFTYVRLEVHTKTGSGVMAARNWLRRMRAYANCVGLLVPSSGAIPILPSLRQRFVVARAEVPSSNVACLQSEHKQPIEATGEIARSVLRLRTSPLTPLIPWRRHNVAELTN